MSDVKILKSIDITSYTIMGTGMEYYSQFYSP